MGQVQTIKGPIDSSALGRTLMHEHVFVRTTEVEANWPTGWDRDLRIRDAVDRLGELKAIGIDTIVDPTVVGIGRDIELVREVASNVELNIVVATGLYTYDALPHYFDIRTSQMQPSGVDALDEFFLFDIDNGIASTGARPGVLKCATDEPGVTHGVERVLRAVARVHRRTGVPIVTHTHVGTRRGLDQQRIFSEEGVDLSRVVIGHSGDSTDLDYLEQLLGAGSTLGMDRFGLDIYCPTKERVDTIVSLCERGWASQLVLSQDASCHIDWVDEDLRRNAMPNWHYLHISRDVLPALRESGVAEEQIELMLVGNPRRILDHGAGY